MTFVNRDSVYTLIEVILVFSRKIQGKNVYERPSTMFLDWLLKTEKGNRVMKN